MFKILDLFSGAGGFSLGFDSNNSFKTVVACDSNDKALETFKKNFPETYTILGDLTKNSIKNKIIAKSKEKGVNMIIGGPPCQGFSLQGKKLGLEDPRNFLFLEYAEMVEKIKPEIFVIENVKNMINAQNGYFINEIVQLFSNMGYNVQYNILNSSHYGVPQKRERAIIVGSLSKKLAFDLSFRTNIITVRDAISDLSYLESGDGSFVENYKLEPQSMYQEKMRANSDKLYNHTATSHKEVALEKLRLIPPESGKEHLPKSMHGKQQFSSTWSRLKWDDVSPTIDTRFDTPSNGQNSHPYLNRAITPREAARLQSFPDTFIFHGNKTAICKQIGNAVPPLLASFIADEIIKNYTNGRIDFEDGSYILNSDSFYSSDKVGTVDHLITDPPYNISVENNLSTLKGNRDGVYFGDWDDDFNVIGWLDMYVPKVKKGGSIIIFCSYRYISDIIRKLEALECECKDVIRWIKSNPMPRNMQRRYVSDHEFAVWAVKKGNKWIFNNTSNSYLRPKFVTPVVSGSERFKHPTQKSLSLMEDIIKIHTNENETILDPFMGTGTTCLACYNLKRTFVGIEREIKYFEIAKSRLNTSNKK